jgi:hypothetical protein
MGVRSSLFQMLFTACAAAIAADSTGGFQNARWGMAPDEVRKSNSPKTWSAAASVNAFPKDLGISTFLASQEIAGKAASVTYYFFENKFFQATARFDCSDLKNFDFNYNVYRSVDSYYRAIHDRTLTFVYDIFDLLRKKYGKKEPSFRGADPRRVFSEADEYIGREAWNLRSYPYDYFKKIVASTYARWEFPNTTVIFSIVINAPEKQFDYQLSLSSPALAAGVNAKKDSLRTRNL